MVKKGDDLGLGASSLSSFNNNDGREERSGKKKEKPLKYSRGVFRRDISVNKLLVKSLRTNTFKLLYYLSVWCIFFMFSKNPYLGHTFLQLKFISLRITKHIIYFIWCFCVCWCSEIIFLLMKNELIFPVLNCGRFTFYNDWFV